MSRRKTAKTKDEGLIELTKAAEKTSAPGGKNLMYVGPTIPAFAIQNQVYTGVPEAAKDILAKDPELGNLFIEIRDYPKANRMLRERAGYIYRAYLKALELRK